MGIKYKSKDKYAFFYTFKENNSHTCKVCVDDIIQNLRNGYRNLLNHLNKHDWEPMISDKDTKTKLPFSVDTKAINVHKWLKWIFGSKLPFSFADGELTRNNTNLESRSRQTLTKDMHCVVLEVEQVIRLILPDSFGLVLDGWSDGGSHFIGAYALCPDGSRI